MRITVSVDVPNDLLKEINKLYEETKERVGEQPGKIDKKELAETVIDYGVSLAEGMLLDTLVEMEPDEIFDFVEKGE